MNKRITFTQAISGYQLYFEARRLSRHTFSDYSNTFRKFALFLGDDPPIDEITPQQIEEFLAAQEVSKKTVLNYHTGLSALWTWAVKEGIAKEHILHRVDRPKPEKRHIKPYSEADVRAMLAVIDKSRPYIRPGKVETIHTLPSAERNRAIILLLLDTGLRASELCGLRLHQVDMRNRHIIVIGKGSKERMLPFCARTGQAIWRYLATRPDDAVEEPLFITETLNSIDRHDLRKALLRIGRRAGVRGVNVHRFRHTFAINYLRNGGDPYSLQRLLGHSTMDMVKRYLNIAQADLDKSHRLASPVDNWRL
jgi:site-specific recombinase XerD